MTYSTKKYLVVGLGVSGMSVVRYLSRHGLSFEIAETNSERLQLLVIQEPLLKSVVSHTQTLTAELLCQFDAVVVSPGVPVRAEVFKRAIDAGVDVIGDIELFAREVNKPVLAVTGSNGKSTVVSMAGALLKAANINAEVVGNVGFACLDSLEDDSIEAYVLELSSFQLETTFSLKPLVASVLNVSADHLDRYNDLEDYAQVKRGIYQNATHVVFNTEDNRTVPANMAKFDSNVSFGVQAGDWSIVKDNHNVTLRGKNVVDINASVLKVAGEHNQLNALAAMAMASLLIKSNSEAGQADLQQTFSVGLAEFTGLPHRAKLVCESDNVTWINDSKGTNVGATVSAIQGMSSPVVLIAGGRGKNADYQPLREVVEKCCSAVVLIGEDALKIKAALADSVPMYCEESMAAAVKRAALISKPGDCVLLSPACASFDMFKNFEDRGNAFESEVRKLCA